MARKMNLPTGDLISTQNNADMISDVEVSSFEKMTDDMNRDLVLDLKYNEMTDEEIAEKIGKGEGTLEKMIRLFERYGSSLEKCDDILAKIDETKSPQIYKKVQDFSITIEGNHNALISYFSRLSYKDKLSSMNIDSEYASMSEIEGWKEKIREVKYFPSKEREQLLQCMDELVKNIEDAYNKIKNDSIISLLFVDLVAVTFIYFICKFLGWLLWSWVPIAVAVFYCYLIIKKYGQLSSVAKKCDRNPQRFKIFLASIALGGNKS